MNEKSYVATSRTGHIGGHEIVDEVGPIKAEKPGFLWFGDFENEAEAIDALKDVARSKGANGIIHMRAASNRRWSISGIAVRVRKIGTTPNA
jgi:hypothetical protein